MTPQFADESHPVHASAGGWVGYWAWAATLARVAARLAARVLGDPGRPERRPWPRLGDVWGGKLNGRMHPVNSRRSAKFARLCARVRVSIGTGIGHLTWATTFARVASGLAASVLGDLGLTRRRSWPDDRVWGEEILMRCAGCGYSRRSAEFGELCDRVGASIGTGIGHLTWATTLVRVASGLAARVLGDPGRPERRPWARLWPVWGDKLNRRTRPVNSRRSAEFGELCDRVGASIGTGIGPLTLATTLARAAARLAASVLGDPGPTRRQHRPRLWPVWGDKLNRRTRPVNSRRSAEFGELCDRVGASIGTGIGHLTWAATLAHVASGLAASALGDPGQPERQRWPKLGDVWGDKLNRRTHPVNSRRSANAHDAHLMHEMPIKCP
jgi:tetrahydromethanopterin S-methyltransferase subunit G